MDKFELMIVDRALAQAVGLKNSPDRPIGTAVMGPGQAACLDLFEALLV